MLSRQKGFTLIELLVVIAIIGILAAMLFPVFARARESARKTQCLSNVKNVAMAFQMYISDYDRFPPAEVDANVNNWFYDYTGGNSDAIAPGCCSTQANPYLRWPVILDEYIKNRDVWRCPSAKMVSYPKIILGNPNWFWEFAESGNSYCPCGCTWPNGWGGSATDTACSSIDCIGYGSRGSSEIKFGIGMSEHNLGQSTGVVNDAAKHVIVADVNNVPFWGMVEQVAFPDVCRVGWGRGCTPDFESDCGSSSCSIDDDQLLQFWTDPSFRKQYTRHMGGSNIGFMDGHAKWMAADSIVAAVYANPPDLEGLGQMPEPLP